MAKKSPSRKDLLKKPDEFLSFSQKALEFFSAHKKALRYLGTALGGLAVIYMAGSAYLDHVNKKGQEALNKAEISFLTAVQGGIEPGKLQETKKLFREVLEQHGWSDAARLALPQLAQVCYLMEDYDEAVVLYRDFLVDVRGDVLYEAPARLALAACYEAMDELDAAIAIIRPLVNDDDIFKERAVFDTARLLRLANKPQEAKKLLERYVEKHGESPLIQYAQSQL